MTEAWSKDNPLNQGNRNVLNVFESSEKMANLKDAYTFFLVFVVSHQARQNVNRARTAIQRKGLDVVTEFSRIFFLPIPEKETGDKDQDDMDGLPRPDFSDIKNSDSYCLWAVRNEEVARIRTPIPVLGDDELMKQAQEIEAAELEAKGPLPEDPNPPAPVAPAVTPEPATQQLETRRSPTPDRSSKRPPAKGKGKKAKKPAVTEPVDEEDPMDIPE